MTLMMFAGSLSSNSLNKKLIRLAARQVEALGLKADLHDMDEFDLPLYRADLDIDKKPANVEKFVNLMNSSQGMILSSPTYNFSVPGPLKNLIDWVSRVRPMPWKGRQILLLSASTSIVGGRDGLWQLRIPLTGCGAFVFPQSFSLSEAHKMLSPEGELTDEKLLSHLNKTISDFVAHLRSLQ